MLADERHEQVEGLAGERDRLEGQARRTSEGERRVYGQGRQPEKEKDPKRTDGAQLARRDAGGESAEPGERAARGARHDGVSKS